MSRADADELNNTMIRGLAEADAAKVASVYAPDARLLPPGMDVQTGEDIQRYWQAPVDAGLRYAHIDTVSYEEHGDLAVEEERWELRASADAPVVEPASSSSCTDASPTAAGSTPWTCSTPACHPAPPDTASSTRRRPQRRPMGVLGRPPQQPCATGRPSLCLAAASRD